MTLSAANLAFPHKLIRASAGAGKTYQLTNRYLRLLFAGEAPDQILATTFTRKAAGEIRDRVLFRLAAAARDEAGRAELAAALDLPRLTRDDCLRLLVRVTQRLHRLRIATLDSFFAQWAASCSLELDLPPGWRIVDELVDRRIRWEAVQGVLLSESSQSLLTLLHLLTKGQAERSVAELIRSTVGEFYSAYRDTPPEAWRRVPRPRAPESSDLGQAIQALRDAPLPSHKSWEKTRAADCRRAELRDWEGFVSSGLAARVLAGEERYYGKPIGPEVAAAYQELLGHARANVLNRLADQTEAARRLLDQFDGRYRALKREQRALRFDDVAESLAQAAERTDVARLAYRLDSPLAHLLLDEFQDTSLPQWRVLEPLARAATAGPGKSFFCVGDVKQAIYGWRGGVAEIFHAVDRQLPGLQSEPLDRSYRSSPPVMEAVNEIFSGLTNHSNLNDLAGAVARWVDDFHHHETARSELAGFVRLETAPQCREGQSQPEATCEYAVRCVARHAEAAPACRVGVLVRRNVTVAQMIYHLRRRGIDASEEGGNPLTDSAAVRIVLSLLRTADHPGDTIARFHLANSPLAPVLALTDHQSDSQAHRVAATVRRALLADGYGRAIARWAQPLIPSCNRRERRRLDQLIGLAYNFQSGATLRTRDFLEFVASERVADPLAANVRVMTIHQAKGLEFDVVVLPDLDADLLGQRPPLVSGRPREAASPDRVCRYCKEDIQRLLPESWRRVFRESENREIAESLCVLYVAATRAIHALHMIVAPPKPKERTMPRTYAGLLRAALTDGAPLPPETVAYERGDPKWWEHAWPGRDSDRLEEGVAASRPEEAPIAVRLAPASGRRRRGLDRVAPSGLEGGRRVRLADALHQDPTATGRGLILHAWFEQIEWLDDSTLDDSTLRRLAADAGVPPAEVERLLASFRAMLRRPEIARSLSHQAYEPPLDLPLGPEILSELAAAPLRLEVETERPFAIRDGDAIVRGGIDRLVLLRHESRLVAADVLDFKTDRMNDDVESRLEAKTEYYRPQLQAYRRAVAQFTGLAPERIAARLLFVDVGEVRSV